ncbi:hypothetical protein D0869_13172 [Hortaea werneckii]|uniref:Yeast cell wall synthesis Kre9/Knh1-like N-terminal domain-containing protein n=1 Tax=Hortaea werneckii TaxID=91943 RepID=A0A3M6W5X1_HORWE|nr:hypothetical protein KC324_g6874 [Hortaea werneckii]KAI7578976.1 hypothetical protein KC316_g9631 [Hortaea werneckii]RMX73869.1 hypothetical protein D0869_13172 [Hortaea werneckii]RMY16624.1 hypothetical protein D0868_00226 [Hortaea werneckii]
MSSDFSLFSLFAAGLACLVPVTNAYTQPTGSPEGNAIYTPGSTSVVPAGSPYEITWDPTTSGTVTLVLLKGPSNNAVPQYAIVEGIDNSGSYTWTPSEDLSPTDGPTGYGIELIVDATGQYQYSTQFGISNDGYDADSEAVASSSASAATTTIAMTTSSSEMTSATSAASSVSEATAETTATANATSSTGDVYVTEVVDKFTTYCPYATSFTAGGKTYTVSSATTLTVTDCSGGCTVSKPASMSAPTTAAPVTTAMSSSKPAVVITTGGLPANGSAPYPMPSSLRTSASAGMPSSGANATGSGSPPIQANGASSAATSFVGLAVAAGVAVFAL